VGGIIVYYLCAKGRVEKKAGIYGHNSVVGRRSRKVYPLAPVGVFAGVSAVSAREGSQIGLGSPIIAVQVGYQPIEIYPISSVANAMTVTKSYSCSRINSAPGTYALIACSHSTRSKLSTAHLASISTNTNSNHQRYYKVRGLVKSLAFILLTLYVYNI
jgi:hypothetical protein